MQISKELIPPLMAALAAAAGVYSGVSSSKAENASDGARGISVVVLETALKQLGEAQLAGFNACLELTEHRISRGKEGQDVLPSVPKSIKALVEEN